MSNVVSNQKVLPGPSESPLFNPLLAGLEEPTKGGKRKRRPRVVYDGPCGLKVIAYEARRIVTGGGSRVRGIFPSTNFGHPVHWESPIERPFIHALELSRLVGNVIHQPARFVFQIGDRVVDYTPDYLLLGGRMEPTIAECKAKKFLQLKALADRLDEIRGFFQTLGVRFVVVDDTRLKEAAIAHNVNLLRVHARSAWRTSDLQLDATFFGASGMVTFGALVKKLGRAKALRIVATGALGFDFRQKLTDMTLVYQPIQEAHDVARILLA